MEIHEIRYFLVLSETLNFTRAAERCNVSQPALTRAIQNLEDKLGGGPLVHRERGNTHLTELGRMMRPYFEQMFAGLEDAKNKAKDYAKSGKATLTIGLMCTIGPSKLIDLFTAFRTYNEGVELYLKDASATTLEELLAQGELDIAIYCKPEVPSERFHVMPLYTERFVVAIAKDHALARLNAVNFKDLDGQNYLNRVNCEYFDYLKTLREQSRAKIQCPYRSERDDWIQSMVAAGLGFTFIPEFAVTIPGLAIRQLVQPEVIRTVNLVTVRGRPHSPAVGAFVREAKRYPWRQKLDARRDAPDEARLKA
jgi:DNA-binding transcriptional LysR family regulator